jgi:two-component system OmpR family sensor kinase
LKLRLLPMSLAGRTILFLLVGFALIQLLGLLIHTLNQINLERIEEERSLATRAIIIYRHVALASPSERAVLLSHESLPDGGKISIEKSPPSDRATNELPLSARQIIRASMFAYGLPPGIHPRGLVLRWFGRPPKIVICFGLPDGRLAGLSMGRDEVPQGQPPGSQFAPDGQPPEPPPGGQPPGMGIGMDHSPADNWLIITSPLVPPAPWHSPGFATAFIVMTILGAIMISWAVRQLLIPVRTLAQAAERLGRDVTNAPPLPETGPSEIVIAAAAFNTMAARIRRFVEDRTFLLTAIGHDLRTPITRLKLRAEYMEDEEQRVKMLADLDEMEAMVAATLAFGRDVATTEPVARIDLAILLRTILDEAADGAPDLGEVLEFTGPAHFPIAARSLALKRVFVNLIGNALKYGDAARVTLHQPVRSLVQIDIDDNGPGIERESVEYVFEPFHRLETSRNRETGGSGLGLSIARNIVRAHGGDILLTNLPGKGLRASVTLPI